MWCLFRNPRLYVVDFLAGTSKWEKWSWRCGRQTGKVFVCFFKPDSGGQRLAVGAVRSEESDNLRAKRHWHVLRHHVWGPCTTLGGKAGETWSFNRPSLCDGRASGSEARGGRDGKETKVTMTSKNHPPSYKRTEECACPPSGAFVEADESVHPWWTDINCPKLDLSIIIFVGHMKSVIIFATFSMFVGLQWLLSRFPPMKGNFTSAWVNHQAPVGAKVMNFVHLCTGDKGKVCGFWRMRVEHVEFTMVLKAEFLGRTIHFQRHWRTFFFGFLGLFLWTYSVFTRCFACFYNGYSGRVFLLALHHVQQNSNAGTLSTQWTLGPPQGVTRPPLPLLTGLNWCAFALQGWKDAISCGQEVCFFCCWCQVFKWFNPEISWCLFTIVYPLPILEDPNRRSSSLDLSPAINELDTFYPNHCLIQSVDLTSSPLPDTDCADMMRRWCKLNDGIATPVRLLQCGHPTNFNGFITP